MDHLLTDLRYAVRQVLHAPGFSAIAIATLALGIGANSALFTVADAVLRRPRPGVGEASTLVWVSSTSRDRRRPSGLSLQVADRIREEVPQFEQVSAMRDIPLSLATRGEPVMVKGQAVSGDYFAMLRTPMALGRGLIRADHTAGAQHVTVLSHHAWTTWFSGDSSIVGRSVVVNGMPLTVLGVTARGFNGNEHDEEPKELWVPSTLIPVLLPAWRWIMDNPAGSEFRVMARLRSSTDEVQATAALRRLSAVIVAADTSRAPGWSLATYDASAGVPAGGAESLKGIAALAIAVTGLILLICCANVSNLMLARALGRQREIATRLSIGASRSRVVRQLLTESVLLAAMASVAGMFLAVWGTELLLATAIPIPLDTSVDWRVVVVSSILALGTGILFGIAPALHTTRGELAGVLREAATGGDRQRTRLQGLFVVAQVALSLLLLTMSGLFLRSLDKARRLEIGFDASKQVLALSVDVGLLRYDSTRALAFSNELLARAEAMPEVESATLTSQLPLSQWSRIPIEVEASVPGTTREARYTALSEVRPAFFQTIGISLVAGRDFSATDSRGSPAVAIVSEGFVRGHLEGRPALGARIRIGGEANKEWLTIIGVVKDAILQSLESPEEGGIYVPLLQHPRNALTVLVRSRSADAGPLASPLRDIVRSMDAALPIIRVSTMDIVREEATTAQRHGAVVLAIFGGLALLLAAIGLHGVMLFTVRQRTREIGIRIALGATRHRVVHMFVRHGLRLTLVGGAAGVVLALAATQLLRSMLFGIAPTDAVTFLVVSLLFLVVAFLSTWFPARRAARIDPVAAMRAE